MNQTNKNNYFCVSFLNYKFKHLIITKYAAIRKWNQIRLFVTKVSMPLQDRSSAQSWELWADKAPSQSVEAKRNFFDIFSIFLSALVPTTPSDYHIKR
jgi:hypothetical protein